MATCKSCLATRPLLYTDSIKGQQVCRDDMWAVTTEELNKLHEELEALKASQGEPVAWMDKNTGECLHGFDSIRGYSGNFIPLYTSAPTIPEGYLLIKRDTLEYIYKAAAEVRCNNISDLLEVKAILAAAPEYKGDTHDR